MTDIAVANKDWAIVAGVIAALDGAEIQSEKVFQDVTVATSSEQAAECQFVGPTPKVIVRYVTTAEIVSPEDVRGCHVILELMVSTRVTGGRDESSRAQEILRLTNAARNAIEADPPAGAAAWAQSGHHHAAIWWGRPQIDVAARPPWAVCRLPVEIGFVLETGTAH